MSPENIPNMKTENAKILKSMTDLETRVKKYNENLNNSGVWLFLATLGCWSVDPPYIKIMAVVFTFTIFSHQLITRLDSFKLFSTDVTKIKEAIEKSSLLKDLKQSRLFELQGLEKKWFSYSRFLKHIPAYYLSGIFLVTSMFYWVDHIASQEAHFNQLL
ncbi:MAG TPA: hypothetical protein VIF10_16885 [Methylobacter sp.]|jgi:hypothetical protein